MNWFLQFLRRRPPTPPPLVWKTQFANHLMKRGDDPVLHYASSRSGGGFDIFEDGHNFLLSFPRRMNRPAELFDNLAAAKDRAALSEKTP